MEVPAIPKVVLDNLLPAEFKESSAPLIQHSNGFRQLSLPFFHGVSLGPPATATRPKSPAASLPPLPGGNHMRDFATSAPPPPFKDCVGPFANEGSGLPPIKAKPKRVRKSRAEASSKKRGACDTALDSNVEGGPQSQLPPKRRRLSAKLSDGEPVEKPPPRKRNRSKAKAKEELLSLSTHETSFAGHGDATSSKGILGMCGLQSKTSDLSRYMKDISVESLMAGDFNVLPVSSKQGLRPSSSIIDNSFGSHVSSILQNLTRPVSTDQTRLVPLFSKPAESKPLKFFLDLESSPIDENEECLGIGLLESKVKALPNESSTPLLQCKKAQESPSLFSLESIPVTPPANFWNTLQIHSNGSLSSLLAQASTTRDSRFFPLDVGPNCEKSTGLPPSIFSLGSFQMPHESSGDRLASSKLNQWFRADPPSSDPPLMEAQPHHSATFSKGNAFPFKLDIECDPPTKHNEKHGVKEGFLDIDLNKQSLEAEAAESIAHSESVGLCGPPEVFNEVSTLVQAKVETCDTHKESQPLQTSVCVNASTPVNEIKDTCNIKSEPGHQDLDHASEMHAASQCSKEMAARLTEESALATTVNKQVNIEQTKDVSMNASSALPTLIVPDMPETDTQEMCSVDVPYSPGMQATAHLLCKMANSSSPFYVERDDEHTLATMCADDAYTHRPVKAAKVLRVVETEELAHKHAAVHESWKEENTAKTQLMDGKDKSMFNLMSNGNGPPSEPWASTPPRHAPKNVMSRMSGSQSSESDKSPCHGPRERRSHGDLSNSNKLQREKQLGVATSCKVSSLFPAKDPKGNPKTVPKTTFLHSLPMKGTPVSDQKMPSTIQSKQSSMTYGDGLTKVSRPRSNIGKNCLQSQRRTNGCPLQVGCSIRSPNSRHALPRMGEVRHGSK